MRHPQSTTPRSDQSDAGVPRSLDGWMLWIASAGFILGGVVATALSLLQPASENGLRVAATCLGLFLTSIGGVIASYGITRAATAREEEAAYTAYLNGVARSIAHVYSTLHEATENRRSGTYAHEETYQESVIMSAEALLTQFDGITRFSGSIGSDLINSKAELNTIRKGLFDHSTTDAVVSLGTRDEIPSAEPVSVKCPSCASRVHAKLALRAGWTSMVSCPNCKLRFNIHRRPDMSVYASPPKPPSHPAGVAALSQPSVAERANADNGGEIAGEGPSASVLLVPALIADPPPPATVSRSALAVTIVNCPDCGREIRVRLPEQPPSGPSEIVRSCLNCRLFLWLRTADHSIARRQQATFTKVLPVARDASYPIVECSGDRYRLKASFHQPGDPLWYAVCVQHRSIMAVERSAFRQWLEANDSEFLATRLTLEEAGGKRIISDEAASDVTQ